MTAVGVLGALHMDVITDIAWSCDGSALAVSKQHAHGTISVVNCSQDSIEVLGLACQPQANKTWAIHQKVLTFKTLSFTSLCHLHAGVFPRRLLLADGLCSGRAGRDSGGRGGATAHRAPPGSCCEVSQAKVHPY